MKRRDNRITRDPEFERRREDAMRPSRYLGYDHHRLALYFIERKAWKLAELELRRAVFLNPFEPRFGRYLAICEKHVQEAAPHAPAKPPEK